MNTTKRSTSRKLPEVLITLQFSGAYLQKDFLPMDATCRQELEVLRLSYMSKSAKFQSLLAIHYNWYLCSRAHRLGFYKAKAYLLKLIDPETNLVCYLRKYNPRIIGYGWSKDGTEAVNTRLRKHFIAAILEGKTEITLKIPEKLLQEGYKK